MEHIIVLFNRLARSSGISNVTLLLKPIVRAARGAKDIN